MADPNTIKTAWERMQKAVKRKPEIGIKTVETKIRLLQGTTCQVEHKDWQFNVDIGKPEGGNEAGPGPGILQRGAFGSCLIIGYVQQAAIMGIPVGNIDITVEADKDVRGRLGIDNRSPGSKELRYQVTIESPANDEEIMKVIETADRYSPLLDDFKRAIPVKREVKIVKSNETEVTGE